MKHDIRQLSDKDFDAEIQQSGVPIVVEFYAEWERPWRGLTSDDWGFLRAEYGDEIRCACLDTGKNRNIALRYKVETIPNVFVFMGETVVAQFFGRTKLSDVRASLERALARKRAAARETRLPTKEIPRPARQWTMPSFA